jgi:sacsin
MISVREPITNRIATILDEHPDDSQIARELLQNSDDAGATVQWYLLDRTHHFLNQTDEPKLFHKDLREYMGPALLAGNDSLFQAKDFKPIRSSVYSEGNDEAKIDHIGFNR